MLDQLIHENLSGHVPHDLMNIDHGAPDAIIAEAHRFDMWIKDLKLPRPVLANVRMSSLATALHGIGPVDIGLHQRKNGIDLTGVERAISLFQQLPVRFRRHANYLRGPAHVGSTDAYFSLRVACKRLFSGVNSSSLHSLCASPSHPGQRSRPGDIGFLWFRAPALRPARGH